MMIVNVSGHEPDSNRAGLEYAATYHPDHPTGIVPGLTNEQYHAAPGVSNSGLGLIERSPAHYFARYLDPSREPEVQTPAMRAGSALHTAILEPDDFMARYAVEPLDVPRRPSVTQLNAKNPSAATVAAINFWQEFDAFNAGREIITRDDYDTFMRCAEAVRSHPAVSFLFGTGVAEQSVFARDPETGVLVKSRPDYLAKVDAASVYLDIKSTDDARPDMFGKSCHNYGYNRQVALGQDVLEWAGLPRPDATFLIAFERTRPFGVIVYEPDAEFMDKGRSRYRRPLDIYASCLAADNWPCYPQTVTPLSLPRWAA